MRNPWLALPDERPFVLPADKPYVDAWNEAAPPRKRLATELLPEPFVGPRNASVVILGRNPGLGGTDHDDHDGRRPLAAALREGIGAGRHAHLWHMERFSATGGGRWWLARTRQLRNASGLGPEQLARRLLSVEFHGYHSVDWATLPVTLPSQWYGFDLVSRAMERGAVIVLTRGVRDWEVAVPRLRSYRRAFRTNTARSAFLTTGNLGKRAFRELLAALAR